MPTPANITASPAIAPASGKKPRKTKTPFSPDWLTGVRGMQLVGITTYTSFLQLVDAKGVRTRQLFDGGAITFNREDLERVAAEAVRVGMPKRPA